MNRPKGRVSVRLTETSSGVPLFYYQESAGTSGDTIVMAGCIFYHLSDGVWYTPHR